MILMGTYETLPSYGDFQIFNLSSLLDQFPRLNLMPPDGLMFTYDNTFDIAYYNYIIQNDNTFMSLMTIIMNEYNGNNTYILVSYGEGYDYINESLCKLIQVRYGIIVQQINENEDYETIRDDTDVSFSIFGLPALETDKERYSEIISQSMNIE